MKPVKEKQKHLQKEEEFLAICKLHGVCLITVTIVMVLLVAAQFGAT